jgi:hypothetical protein
MRSVDNFDIGWYPDVKQQGLLVPLPREFLPHVLRYVVGFRLMSMRMFICSIIEWFSVCYNSKIHYELTS